MRITVFILTITIELAAGVFGFFVLLDDYFVEGLVHVSALGVGGGNEPSDYLRSKARGEAVWKASGLDVTVLHGLLLGPMMFV